jgi:hypothetical protein
MPLRATNKNKNLRFGARLLALAKEILDKGENKRRGIAAQEKGHP